MNELSSFSSATVKTIRATTATTRAGSKRAAGEAIDADRPTWELKKPSKKIATAADSKEPATEDQHFFRFLDLSPELRNRVYKYAKEDDTRRFALHPIHLSADSHRKSYSKRTWEYFAVTQVCKQVRAEYRPIWVQDLRVRFESTSEVTLFADTFLHHGSGNEHTPKTVQFSWNHGNDNITSFDLMPLLRLRARHPPSRVTFVPHMIAAGRFAVDDDICRSCRAQIHEYEDVSDYDNCECPDHDWTRREWSAFKFEQMKYTHSIRNFIRNLNKSWLKAVREDKMTVTYGINEERCHGTFRILCREPICQTTTESQPALDLLEQWGIFDLIVKKCTVFVMAYEDEQITERNGRKITNSVVREVRVYKVATKHQAASSI
ncbi:unnamed protein product [Alternaria alternata]